MVLSYRYSRNDPRPVPGVWRLHFPYGWAQSSGISITQEISVDFLIFWDDWFVIPTDSERNCVTTYIKILVQPHSFSRVKLVCAV